jgi:hypothetical protein
VAISRVEHDRQVGANSDLDSPAIDLSLDLGEPEQIVEAINRVKLLKPLRHEYSPRRSQVALECALAVAEVEQIGATEVDLHEALGRNLYLIGASLWYNLSGKPEWANAPKPDSRPRRRKREMKEDSADKNSNLTVTVHDEDAGGDPLSIHAGRGTPLSTVIEKLYRELKTERQEGDRLVCIGSGGDVFPHQSEHLGDYAAASCKELEWGWSRKTGGA